MSIGIVAEHKQLRTAVGGFLSEFCPSSVPRGYLDIGDDALPPFWSAFARHGWLGVHISAERGGEGYGLLEAAVILEALGYAVAPGPLMPTMLCAAIVDRYAAPEVADALVPEMVTGRVAGTVAFGEEVISGRRDGDSIIMTGQLVSVMSAAAASTFVVPVRVDDTDWPTWVVARREDAIISDPSASVDRTRPVAAVQFAAARINEKFVLGHPHCAHVLHGSDVRDLAATMLAAEAAGGASWCVESAAAHARIRQQFGRPIGQFQGVKHRCANMLMSSEQLSAIAWDAALSWDKRDHELTSTAAATVAAQAYLDCAKGWIQVLGGIGYTWEHDAHLYLKRAMSMVSLLGSPSREAERLAQLVRKGARREVIVLGQDCESMVTADVAAFLHEVVDLEPRKQLERIVDAGYLVPHWPRPWGRDSTASEGLAIAKAFDAARVNRPQPGLGSFILPAIIVHGSEEERLRFVRPSMLGEISWCQLFSEPEAGSDLAALSTRADRDGDGWRVNGAKVWTTQAHIADWGVCLARTNRDVPKHRGLTYFLIDMHSVGIEVRPLRDITGECHFNQVFLNDVFVSADCVVGDVGAGWQVARTTLANERVVMSNGSAFGHRLEDLLTLIERLPEDQARWSDAALGSLIAEAFTITSLGRRASQRAISSASPGPESSLQKLLGVEHDQRVHELALGLLGTAGASRSPDSGPWINGFLSSRSLTIAGGTSEIQRNIIGERLLGLPRDPE